MRTFVVRRRVLALTPPVLAVALLVGALLVGTALVGTLLLLGRTTHQEVSPSALSQPNAATTTDQTPASASGSPAPAPSAAQSPVQPAVPVRPADPGSARPAERPAPVRLELPGRGIDVPVDPVGVEQDGQMEIPPRAERAGWYRYGASPGEPAGTAVIAAHVDSVASGGLGPFARLADVAVGDAVVATLADGSLAQYQVTDVARVPKDRVPWNEVFARDGSPRLVLVTCGGTFRSSTGHYADNVIVTASPAGG